MTGDFEELSKTEGGDAFRERTILLCVTGGIAAFKAASLASAWTQRGAKVRCLLTESATKFVTPLLFQSITRQPATSDIWRAEEEASYRPEHIDAAEADLAVVAPATANTIATLAHGLASDVVSVSLLAYDGPLVVCPAMNDKMWAHVAVQENVRTLADRGARIVGPGVGHLACGSHGAGRLAPLEDIDAAVIEVLTR